MGGAATLFSSARSDDPVCKMIRKGFRAYQNRAVRLARYPERGFEVYYPAIGLAQKAGDILGYLKAIVNSGGEVAEANAELKRDIGVALWHLAALARDLGVTLGDIALDNLGEMEARLYATTVRRCAEPGE